MNIKLFSLVIICFLFAANGAPMQNLWDQVVRKEQVILTVIYKGRSLNVWKQNLDNYAKFYVTPLCTFDFDSITCQTDEYSVPPRSVFSFKVKLWDFEVATIVQKALKRQNIIAQTGDIYLLPMQQVRINLGSDNPIVQPDPEWRSFADESQVMGFDLYPINDTFCHKMVNDAKNNTEFFLRALKLNFEFSMASSSTSSRTIKITDNFLQNSSFYSKLTNKNTTDGIVYLKSEDANKLAQEVFHSTAYNEEISSDYEASHQEGAIVKELLKTFEQDKVTSDELTKENWDSVFWDDIFTRPDILTEYANNVMEYDEHENQFKYNEEKARAFRNKVTNEHKDSIAAGVETGIGFEGLEAKVKTSAEYAHEEGNSNEDEKKTKDIIKFDDFQKVINDNKLDLQWKGKKYVQKSFDLYRVNTKEIKTASEIAFKRVIVDRKQSSQKIEIKKETNETTKFDNIYDEIPTTTTTTTTATTPTTTTSTTTTTTTTTKPPSTTTMEKQTTTKCNPVDNEFSIGAMFDGFSIEFGRNKNVDAPCQNSVPMGIGYNYGNEAPGSYNNQPPVYDRHRQPVSA